jgi:hypothetical protein
MDHSESCVSARVVAGIVEAGAETYKKLHMSRLSDVVNAFIGIGCRGEMRRLSQCSYQICVKR